MLKKCFLYGLLVIFALFSFGCSRAVQEALESVNTAPVIQSLSAIPSSVNVGNSAVLNCVATDANGDSLSYSWSAAGGMLVSNVGSSVSWTAPSTGGIYSVTVSVSDGKASTSGSLNITVSSASDSTAPSVPGGASASAGNQLVYLSWTANTESDLAGYNVYRSTTSGSGFSKINSSLVEANSYMDSGLSNGTTYYYKITAQDTSGNESGFSAEISAAPTSSGADSTAPAAPQGLSAIAGANSVNLTWTANTESDLVGYNIYRSTSAGESYSKIASVGKVARYQDRSAQSSTSYYYKITAVDLSNNESGYSSVASIETKVLPPLTPSGLAVSQVSANSALVSWGSVADATSYTLSYGTDSSASSLGTASTVEASLTLTSLTASTNYYIKVRSANAGGSSAYSNIKSFTTAASSQSLNPPSTITITDITSTSATVSWEPVSGATAYNISYGEDEAATNLGTLHPTTNSYNFTGLTAGKTYYLKVASYNASGGTGAYSEIVSFTTVSPPYTFLLKWGSKGSGNSQFNYAGALAADSSANIYVTDYTNSCVQKFTSQGSFVAKWGKSGGGAGSGNGEFSYPSDVAIDSQGNIYVADTWNNRIQVFTSGGTFVRKWGDYSTLYGPFGIAVDSSDNVYVTDGYNNKVRKFTSTGTLITSWGSAGGSAGAFNFPRGIAVDSNGNVYVADQNNHRIQKFTSSGVFVTAWGKKGTGDGEFNEPSRIAVDQEDNICVTDFWNNRIQKFTSSGTFLLSFGAMGSGDGQFFEPSGITIDKDGYLYVSDYNYRVQKFQKSEADLTPINFVSPLSASQEGVIGASLSLQVVNVGAGSAIASDGNFAVGFYISSNNTWDGSDVLLTGGRESVSTPLTTGQTKTVSIYSGMKIPSSISPGNYYLLAVVDEVSEVPESNENNNVAANAITISSTGISSGEPDLTPAGFTTPSTSTPGGVVGSALSLNVTNGGTGSATASSGYIFVGFYISTNESWDSSDTLLIGGREAVYTPIAAGESKAVSIYSGMYIPTSITAGNYYLLAVVDETSSVTESNENNNVAANAITISSP